MIRFLKAVLFPCDLKPSLYYFWYSSHKLGCVKETFRSILYYMVTILGNSNPKPTTCFLHFWTAGVSGLVCVLIRSNHNVNFVFPCLCLTESVPKADGPGGLLNCHVTWEGASHRRVISLTMGSTLAYPSSECLKRVLHFSFPHYRYIENTGRTPYRLHSWREFWI